MNNNDFYFKVRAEEKLVIDNIDVTNYKFMINHTIHQEAKLSKSDFLEEVSDVRFIRTAKLWNLITFYPTNEDDWIKLNWLHQLINDNKFCTDYLYHKVFVLAIPPKLFSWFSNTTLDVIKQQIIHWIAAKGYFDDTLAILKSQLYPPVYQEVQNIVDEHYKSLENFKNVPEGNSETEWYAYWDWETEFENKYIEVCIKTLGSSPPELFKKPEQYSRDSDWGANHEFGFHATYAYFTERDWENIIINKIKGDDLHRVESKAFMWDRWLHVYKEYDYTKSKIFQLHSTKNTKGFIYILREADSNFYKIGWSKTKSHALKRRGGNQTGNPHELSLAGCFEVSSKKTESVLHGFFEPHRQVLFGRKNRSEWFSLTEEQVKNILDSAWRIKHNIF